MIAKFVLGDIIGIKQNVDDIECSVNRTLYPKLVELILDDPEMMNKIVGYDFLDI